MTSIARPTPRITSRRPIAAALGASLLLLVQAGLPAAARAQSLVARESVGSVHTAATPRRRIFAGERALYDLRLAGKSVGTGSLEVLGEERVDGHATMHTVLTVSGGVLFARVNDRFDSWIDPEHLFSRRFVQDQNEVTYRRRREYALSPEQKTFRQLDTGEESELGSTQPLDDVSFLFYARTLPLNVGDVDTIPRYFKPGHDVILRVLRRERITVPAGTFETLVVQPTITNVGGLFGKGGQAEVYFTDDEARTIIQIRSKVPVVGSLSLHLREFRAAR